MVGWLLVWFGSLVHWFAFPFGTIFGTKNGRRAMNQTKPTTQPLNHLTPTITLIHLSLLL
jgi:hypothetical protein